MQEHLCWIARTSVCKKNGQKRHTNVFVSIRKIHALPPSLVETNNLGIFLARLKLFTWFWISHQIRLHSYTTDLYKSVHLSNYLILKTEGTIRLFIEPVPLLDATQFHNCTKLKYHPKYWLQIVLETSANWAVPNHCSRLPLLNSQ